MGGSVVKGFATLAGFTAGALLGNPWLGLALGQAAGSAIDGKMPQRKKIDIPPGLDDGITAAQASWGIPIPWVFGRYRVGNNFLWADKKFEFIIDERERGEETAEFLATFAVGICRGPISRVLKVWFDGEVVLDFTSTDGQNDLGQLGENFDLRIYTGSETQEPDPIMVAIETGKRNPRPVPAYRGLAYAVFHNLDLYKLGLAGLPQIEFLVATATDEEVPYEELPILPAIQVPDPPENTWPGEVVNVVSWETGDFFEAFGGAGRGEEEDGALVAITSATVPPGQTRAMRMLTEGGSQSYVNLTKPDLDSGSLSGESFLSNDVWVTFIFRFDDAPSIDGCVILSWQGSSTRLASLALGADKLLRMYNSSDVLVATANAPLTPGIWHRIDAFHGNGNPLNYVCKIDGVPVIESSASSVTTAKQFINIGKTWDLDDPAPVFTCWYGPVIATIGAQIPDGNIFATMRAPVPVLEDYPELGDATDPMQPEPVSKANWTRKFYNPPPTGNWDPVPISSDEKMWLALGNFGIGEDTLGVDTTGFLTADASASNYCVPACGPVSEQYNTALVYAVKVHVCAADANPIPGVTGDVYLRMYCGEVIDDVLGISVGLELPDGNGPSGNQHFEGTSIIRTEDPLHSGELFTLEGANLVFPGIRINQADTPVVAQASVIVVHGDLTNDTKDELIPAEDNLVWYADNRRCLIMEQGIWDRWDADLNQVLTHVEHRNNEELRAVIPIDGCDFDIDEDGNVYSCRWTESSDLEESHLVRMDGTTLIVTEAVDDLGSEIQQPTRIRVVRNVTYPWVAILAENGASLYILNRSTLRWGSSYRAEIPAPDGFLFVALDVDDETGTIWLLASEDDSEPTESRVVRIVPEEPIPPIPTVFDVTAQVGAADSVSAIRWNNVTDELMVGTSDPEKVVWYTVEDDTLTLVDSNSDAGVMSIAPKSAWRRGAFGDNLIYAYNHGSGSDEIKQLDIRTHEITRTWEVEPHSDDSLVPNWIGGSVFDVIGVSVVTGCDLETAAYCRIWLNRASPEDITLGSIVSAVCEEVGIGSSERNTTALTQIVDGYALNDRKSARVAIEALMPIYLFDVSEHDGKLYFLNRPGTLLATIPEEDLAAHDFGGDRPQNLIITRQQAVELPLTMEIAFRDVERDFLEVVESSFRQVTDSKATPISDSAVAMTTQAARQSIEKFHRATWLAQNRFTVSLGPKYLFLTPADLVMVEANGREYLCRVDGLTVAMNGVIAGELTQEDEAVYESDAGGIVVEEEEEAPQPGEVTVFVIDPGLLHASDDRAGVYFAVFARVPRGANVEISRDGGTSFNPWVGTDKTGVVGSARTVLGDVASPWIKDEGNSVQIILANGETLSSCTEAELLAGANRAYLGGEIIHFQTATAVVGMDDTYLITGLLRGREGTEWATGTHAAGEQFMLLDPARYDFGGLEPSDRNNEILFRASVPGRRVGPPGPVQRLTPVFRNLMPLAPQNVEGARDDDDDLTITWLRRCRFRGSGELGYDFPIGESSESYEVDILSGPSGSVLRTLTSTSESVEYTATQQTADGFTPGEAITVKVYQMSSRVGRGYGTEATV